MRRFRRFRPLRLDRLARAASFFRWFILVVAVLYLMLRLADLILLGPIAAVAEMEARRLAVEAVNRVVTERVGQSLQNASLVQYEKDQSGRIAAYQINTPLINQVAAQAALAVQEELRRLAAHSFGVPVGALTRTTLLGTTGPRLPVKLVPVGTVAIDIKQEFKGEGINQSSHRIWLQATATMRIVLPLTAQEVTVTQEIPLSETVIVGPVPESFYGGDLGRVSIPIKR